MPVAYSPPDAPVPFTLPYPGKRLEWAADVIGWSNNYLGRRLELDHGSLRQMLNGRRRIPDTLAYWIENLVQTHMAFPQPHNWHDKPYPNPNAPVDVNAAW